MPEHAQALFGSCGADQSRPLRLQLGGQQAAALSIAPYACAVQPQVTKALRLLPILAAPQTRTKPLAPAPEVLVRRRAGLAETLKIMPKGGNPYQYI